MRARKQCAAVIPCVPHMQGAGYNSMLATATTASHTTDKNSVQALGGSVSWRSRITHATYTYINTSKLAINN